MKSGPQVPLWAVFAATSLLIGCSRGADPPAPAQRRSPALLGAHDTGGASAELCGLCHPAIVDEWRSSGHAASWTSPLVQEEYILAPVPACQRCHAPAAELGEEPTGKAAHDGVDCGSCHGPDVHDQRARGSLDEGSGAGLGAGSMTSSMTSSVSTSGPAERCGGCHQFRFSAARDPAALAEADAIPYADGWLQDTVGEWARSDAGRQGVSCLECHMRKIDDHRSHRFPGMYDRELVAEAVEVELNARRQGGRVFVDVLLKPGKIGHAFPTGDLFREAVLRVWTEEAESDQAEFRLKRWFDDRAEEDVEGRVVTSRVEVTDTRVPPPGAGLAPKIELELRSPAALNVAWTLDLYARAPASEGDRKERVTHVADGRAGIVHRLPSDL